MKTVSFGGLGDCVNVFCKLYEMNFPVEHLFVESNGKTLELIEEFYRNFLRNSPVRCLFDIDLDYKNNFYSGIYRQRIPLNTSWNGEYFFPRKDRIICSKPLPVMYRKFAPETKNIVIQSYGGVNKSREWKFEISNLVKVLKNVYPEYEITTITNEKSLTENIDTVLNSNLFIGLSGFHNYLRTNQGLKNIMLEESEEHTRHYIREQDINSDHLKIIKIGSIQEILMNTKELL